MAEDGYTLDEELFALLVKERMSDLRAAVLADDTGEFLRVLNALDTKTMRGILGGLAWLVFTEGEDD